VGLTRWRSRCVAGLVVTLTVLAWPAVAFAHVTVDPTSAPRGAGDVVLTFRVPNEMPRASVVGLRVQFPSLHPIAVVSPLAMSGWTVTTKSVRLTTPIKTDDGTFTTVVSEVDWTGGSIAVGQFGEFTVLAQGLPDDTGQLVFRALQQYSNGQSVAWIDVPTKGDPDPEHPAPVLTLTSGAAASGTTTTAPAPAASGSTALTASDKTSNWPAVVALIVAGFAIVLALLTLWLTRPSMQVAPAPEEEQTGSDVPT
jgi:periplasmic copper chaperone A